MESSALFSNKQLKKLIVPLLLDQLFNVLVGMADTVMVSHVGETAVSAVSLVDTLNLFFLMIFSGLATGGSIICAQLIGVRRKREAQKSANQLLLTTFYIALCFFLVSILFKKQLLSFLFGSIETDVMENALHYFTFIAISLPFLAVHNGCAALFRASGDSKTPMLVSLVMNVINILGNAFCLYALKMGILGVAIPTLISRIVALFLNAIFVRRDGFILSMRRFSFRLRPKAVVQILKLAMPCSLENSIFQIGKILVLGLIASLGTTAIAANAVANSVLTFQTLTEDAIGLAMITVVGQCVGAGELEQAKKYTKKLLKYTYICMWLVNIPVYFLAPLILNIFHLTNATAEITLKLIHYNCICGLTIWPLAFTLPSAIRAGGNVVYTMVVSLFSMWTFRVCASWIFVHKLHLGIFAVYLAFGMDWLFRTGAFVWKFLYKRKAPDCIARSEEKKSSAS